MNYQAIVAAALAVSGTLAGVYFATVAFVMSATYKDATSRVRALVTRLPVGRVYASIYIQAVVFSLVILAMPMTGNEPNRLSLSVVIILSAFVVLSFGRLRTQLYGLLEPVRLLPVLQRDVVRWTTRATRLAGRDPTGLRAGLTRARTLDSLLALRDLCYLIRDRERSSTNVPAAYAGIDPRALTAARSALAVWLQYARRKHVLVELTGWCFQRPKHKDWLLASEPEVGVALATATTLHAGAIDDALWVERRLAEILGELLGGREVPQLAAMLDGLHDPTRELVRRGMFSESRLWMDVVVGSAKAVISNELAPQPSSTDGVDAANGTAVEAKTTKDGASEGFLYNLVDFVALAYTQAVLGLHDYAQALATKFPSWVVAQASGKNVRSLGPRSTEILRSVRSGIMFEHSVEGRRVTSDAYIRQLVARDVGAETIDEATILLGAFENEFWPWAKGFIDSGTPAAGAALSRLDEALHKWDLPLSAMSELFRECEAAHRDVDDRWPDLSLEILRTRRDILRGYLRSPIAKIATRVESDIDPDRPDVFGWAFYRAHQDLLEDVLSDRTPLRGDLEERLLSLVVASDRATGRLRATVQRNHHSVLGAVWSEPTLMLLQLSGAALVIGLVCRRSDLLEVFARVWGRLLDATPQRVLDVAVTAVVVDDGLFGFTSGAIRRSSRHMQVVGALENMGLARDDLLYGDLEEPPHGLSARAHAMLRHVSFGHLEKIFLAAWLIPEAGRRGATPPSDGLGVRLARLIEEFADVVEEESVRGTETDRPGGVESADD
ncbi:hypothetical protein JNW90_15270 [Micromonospora sp. STR1s_5]|nr:hypothetical protein [Micromonospora sp. STR1s_5]